MHNIRAFADDPKSGGSNPGGPVTCPFNPNHVWPTPANEDLYELLYRLATETNNLRRPYGGAINGIPGTGKGGYLVPAIGDEAHQFIAPTDTDIRGPCPGLNAAANRE